MQISCMVLSTFSKSSAVLLNGDVNWGSDKVKTSSIIQLVPVLSEMGENNQPEPQACQYKEDQNVMEVLFQKTYFY